MLVIPGMVRITQCEWALAGSDVNFVGNCIHASISPLHTCLWCMPFWNMWHPETRFRLTLCAVLKTLPFWNVLQIGIAQTSSYRGSKVLKHKKLVEGAPHVTALSAPGAGGTHIPRHTGTFPPFGSVFCKKSLDIGTTFHWKIPRHGSTFSIKAPGHGGPIWLLCLFINLSADCTVKSATYLLISA